MSSILLVNCRPTRDHTRLSIDRRLETYFTALDSRGPKMGDTRTEPNNGLLIIGHCLRSDGHDVEYLDINVIDFRQFVHTGLFPTRDDILNRIATHARRHDFIFFSSIITGIDDCLYLIDEIKKVYPDKIVLLGGTFPSLKPKYCIEHSSGIDVLVMGEGEDISRKIVRAYLLNDFRELENEQGIIVRRDINGPYNYQKGYNLVNLQELGELAVPDWSLLDPELGPHVYRVMSSRGCGFKCGFCVPSHLSRHTVRPYEKDIFLNTVQNITREHNAETYVIGDLTFFYDQDHSRSLLKGLIERGIRRPFWCQTHLSRINRTNLALLKEAGCAQLAVGIESINPSILENINKGVNEREIVKKLLLIRDHGIEVQAYFIIGLPGDDLETIRLNKSFIRYGVESGLIDRTHIGIYVPYPGPPMNEEILLEDFNYAHYTQGVFRDIPTVPVFSTPKLTKEQIQDAYVNCLGSVGRVLKRQRSESCSSSRNNNDIILGAELLSIAQKLREYSKNSSKITVFNIVQGIRSNSESFVSNNIQEVGSIVFGNAEIYSPEELLSVTDRIEDSVDLILFDADIKTVLSHEIIACARESIKKEKLMCYSDTQAWINAVLNIILFQKGHYLRDLSIYLTPSNRNSRQLGSLLENYGAEIIIDDPDPESLSRIPSASLDVLVSFGINGAVLDSGIVKKVKAKGIAIDAAIGSLPREVYDELSSRQIMTFRPDMRIVIAAEVLMGMEYREFIRRSMGTKTMEGINFVSSGIIGRPMDVVVDSIHDPQKIIGIADGLGKLVSRDKIGQEQQAILMKASNLIKNWE